MIITSNRSHAKHVIDEKRMPVYYCEADAHQTRVAYRKGCVRCFQGFMENARTKNNFVNLDGERRAAYNLEEARLWFFYLYKEKVNEGE